MFGLFRVNSFFDEEIKRCIAEGRTESILNNIKFGSAKKYAVNNGHPTRDHWGNYEEPSDVYLSFEKKFNGENYNITFKALYDGGILLTVYKPGQSPAAISLMKRLEEQKAKTAKQLEANQAAERAREIDF